MQLKIGSREIWYVLAIVVGTLAGVITAQAFSGPTTDPGTAGFAWPCAIALSKDDNCTFDRTTDSLEAVSEKVDTKVPM